MKTLKDYALQCAQSGLSVIPADIKTKIPSVKWKPYQNEIASESVIRSWFNRNEAALGIVSGKISNGLEMLDFDNEGELLRAFAEKVEKIAPGLIGRLFWEDTQSGGNHCAYYCNELEIPSSLELAKKGVKVDGPGDHTFNGKSYKSKRYGNKWHVILTLLETRGEGGYFITAPSKGYKQLYEVSLTQAPVISAEERQILIDVALSLNQWIEPVTQHSTEKKFTERKGLPGTDFNERGDVRAILRKNGWEDTGRTGDFNGIPVEHWRRPGKKNSSSASLIDGKILHVFSSNTDTFKPWTSYGPFSLYALLEHNGDFTEAAKALAKDGYGEEKASAPSKVVQVPKGYTAAELMEIDFPEPKWAIPNVLCDGLNLFGGKPKQGKSMFALNLGITIASGEKAFGEFKVNQGNVIYLALEDPFRRVKRRLEIMLQGKTAPGNLYIYNDWPKLNEGGLVELEKKIHEIGDIGLLMIDTLVKFRGTPSKIGNPYSIDYEDVAKLKDLSDKCDVPTLAVCHLRKELAEDIFDTFSGTLGLTGAADGLLAFAKKRGQSSADLHITGRDIEDAEYALKFNSDTYLWEFLGKSRDIKSTKNQQIIYDAFKNCEYSLSPKEIHDMTGLSLQYVKKTLPRMCEKGEIKRIDRGQYAFIELPD